MRKKSVLVALILFAVLSNPLNLGFKSISATTGHITTPTLSTAYVSGAIASNTTWYSSQSPYIVTGDVTLFPSYTLTIEPGVEVLFYPSTKLVIRGTLNASGTESHRITFTSPNGKWYGISIATELGGKATIKFANFHNATTAIYTSLSNPGYPIVKIYDSVFSNNSIALGGYVGGGATIVERCTFENNTYGITQADYNVYNSVFKKNVYGLYATERVNVYFSTFLENQVGLYGGRGKLMFNYISNNSIGVQGFFEGFTTMNNTIINNDVGIILTQYDTYSSPIQCNNIYGNKIYNLKNTGTADKYPKYNWWGMTNTTEIDLKIYDGYDDPSIGIVYYQPILTGPVTIPPPTHDIAIKHVTASPTSVTPGQSVYITFNIANEGTFDETVVVTVRYDLFQIGNWTGWLGIGQSANVSLYWYTWGVPSGNYTINAKANTVPGETDTADNVFVDGHVTVIGRLSSTISISASPTTITIGESTAISGSISPTRAGVTVTIQYRYLGLWMALATLTTDANSQYSYTWMPSETGTYELKASWPGDANTLSAESSITTVEIVAIVDTTAPIPSFAYTPTEPNVNDVVTIDASASTDNIGIVMYKWDFGDGTTATGMIVTHAFTNPGSYTVRLTVLDAAGNANTVTAAITVSGVAPPPKKVSIKLSGELDYSWKEDIKIKIVAFVTDATTMEPVSNANVTIQIYDDADNLWVSSVMVERLTGTGIYEWTSSDTIKGLGLQKGVYLVRAQASYTDTQMAHDILLFHISLDAIDAEILDIRDGIAILRSTIGDIEVSLGFINATLIGFEEDLATIKTDIGTIKTSIANINATISNINANIVTIQTALGTINGTITSMQGDIATIKTDIGTIKTTLEGWAGATFSVTTPEGAFNVWALTNSTLEGTIEFFDKTIITQVSGPSGTVGITHLVIPKQLFNNLGSSIEKVVATLDDKQIPFTYTEQPEAYMLRIDYIHSTHTIKLFLTGLPPTPFPLSSIIAVITIIFATAVATVYFLKIRKRTSNKSSKS